MPWPADPASPQRPGARPAPRPKEAPNQDARTPDDRDGNEELEREKGSKHGRAGSEARGRDDRDADVFENEDTARWVASERFSLEDELDDTLPNVPRYQEN